MVISVQNVVDIVKVLGDTVKSTREIIKAINDGATYLKRHHPSAKAEVSELLAEMGFTITGLAKVTKVASSFRFVVSDLSRTSRSAERELVRFNDYVIAQGELVAELKASIRSLKGSCSKIQKLRDSLNAQAKRSQQGAMFKLFGLTLGAQARQLSSSISYLYADDVRMIANVEAVLNFTKAALKEVDAALGPRGMASPYNVPRAAALLGTYAVLFDEPQRALDDLVSDLAVTQQLLS